LLATHIILLTPAFSRTPIIGNDIKILIIPPMFMVKPTCLSNTFYRKGNTAYKNLVQNGAVKSSVVSSPCQLSVDGLLEETTLEECGKHAIFASTLTLSLK
jgi:hypothetical protein